MPDVVAGFFGWICVHAFLLHVLVSRLFARFVVLPDLSPDFSPDFVSWICRCRILLPDFSTGFLFMRFYCMFWFPGCLADLLCCRIFRRIVRRICWVPDWCRICCRIFAVTKSATKSVGSKSSIQNPPQNLLGPKALLSPLGAIGYPAIKGHPSFILLYNPYYIPSPTHTPLVSYTFVRLSCCFVRNNAYETSPPPPPLRVSSSR